MLNKKILSLICTVAMISTFMTSMVFVKAETNAATVSISSMEKVGVLSDIAGNLATEDVQNYGPAGKMVYPLYKMTLSISGLYEKQYNSTWTAATGFIANNIKTRIKFNDSLFEFINYVPDSPLGGNAVGGLVDGSTDIVSVSWAAMNKAAVSGEFISIYFIPTTNAEVTAEAVFTLMDDYTSLLVDYYDGTSMNATISDTSVGVDSGLVKTQSFTLNEVTKTDVSITKPSVDTTAVVDGFYNAGILASFTIDADANNAVKSVNVGFKDSANNTGSHSISLGNTAVTSGTVNAALNILNVPEGVTIEVTSIAPSAN